MTKSRAAEIFEIFSSLNHNPSIELNFTNNFTLLVAVILSARAKDKSVNAALSGILLDIDSPRKLIDYGVENFTNRVKSIGLYKTKVKNIFSTAEILINKFNSEVPHDLSDLLSLPGVGMKSANVILNCCFGQPTLAVDTHVFRVSRRLGLTEAKALIKVEEDLRNIIPKSFLHNAHHWLVLHGRYICKAIKPQCHLCPIYHLCPWQNKTSYYNPNDLQI